VETGVLVGADPAETEAAVAAVRGRTAKPLVVKLSPNSVDPAAVAVAAEGAGADAVSLINTLRGTALDPRTGQRWLGGGSGGVSGPAVRAVALEQVAAVAERISVPIVGMGGIASGQDAADFLGAGATVVAVGTESFRDPAAGRRIASELGALAAAGRMPGRVLGA
jgi:dihydroorotate dehydrogenase (NAD+) catalytic subunit